MTEDIYEVGLKSYKINETKGKQPKITIKILPKGNFKEIVNGLTEGKPLKLFLSDSN